jgi:RNA polymerase sigma-70 factor (ECF subfamily)
MVYGWCRRSGLSEEDVADVFQETFRSVSNALGRFEPNEHRGAFRAWLRTVARSKIADQFKRIAHQPQAQGGTEANVRLTDTEDPLGDDSESDAENDHARLVRRVLELIRPQFSERTWTAFNQVAIEGRDTCDVARELNMTDQAVRQANYRVRRRVKMELSDLFKV